MLAAGCMRVGYAALASLKRLNFNGDLFFFSRPRPTETFAMEKVSIYNISHTHASVSIYITCDVMCACVCDPEI